ncbi:MAG: diguanylate cyclase [Proteobacteria bacterium]|nr:diguanylate cyclase [Pseudomonadota bacterium]
MIQFSLDIRTAISLLGLGNMIAACILVAYKIEAAMARPYRQFIAGKTLQALAWALLALRGEIPDLLSADVGNALLFIGFALEVSAVSIAEPTQRQLEMVYAILAGCGAVAFWLLAETPSLRVALASIATISLFGTASAAMLRMVNASQLRRGIAYLYAAFCLVLMFRSGFAVLTPAGFGLMTSNLVQTLAFLAAYLVAIAGGIGFLLLIRERSEQLLAESERTLKTIIETEPECVKVIGPDGSLLQMNRAGLDMIEADSEDQVVGRRVTGIVAPQHREAFDDLCRRVNQGEIGLLEFEIVGLKGTHRWLETHAVPLRNNKGQITGLLGLTRNITERKKADQLLRESEGRYRLLAENSHDVIWTLDLGKRQFSYVSPSVERLRGYTPAEIMAQPMEASLTPESAIVVDNSLRSMFARIAAGDRTRLTGVNEVDQPHRDGHIIHTEVVTTCILDDRGNPVSILGVTRDITDRKKAEQELARLAQTDPLTGLANRRHFMALAEQELARMLRYGGPLSIFMMDIDLFKNINDTYGHQTGDVVLQKLGALFLDALRDVDCIGRIGGEEFAVVLPQTDGDRALEVAERLRSAVANIEVPLARGLPLRLTLSIGVSTLTGGGANLDTVLGQADSALYEAKRSGRNRVCVYGRVS